MASVTQFPLGNNSNSSANESGGMQQSLNILSLILYSLAFLLGIPGNGVVIWVTGFKMKKTVNTVWFLNLAVADFLFTACLPMSIAFTALNFHWPFGKFMCKFTSFVVSLNMCASVYSLLVISVDRCVSVAWPVWAQNHRNVCRASCVSAGVWVVSVILSIPFFIFKDISLDGNQHIIRCYNNYSNDKYLKQFRHWAMTIAPFLLAFVLPFTVIITCYAVIIHRIRRIHNLSTQSHRTFKIIAAVIISFFLCWAPHHIIRLISLVHRNNTFQRIGSPIATSLAYFNSCLNPILYVFMGQDSRDNVRKSIMKTLITVFKEDNSDYSARKRSRATSHSHCQSELNAPI